MAVACNVCYMIQNASGEYARPLWICGCMYGCMRVWMHACNYMYALHKRAHAERCANVMEIMSQP